MSSWVKKRIVHLKWRLPMYYFLVSLFTLGVGYCGWLLYFVWQNLNPIQLVGVFIIIALIIGLLTGYFSARHYQRRLDILHLAVKQAAKSNVSSRITVDPQDKDLFTALYMDFNELMEDIEERTKVLQKLGEEHVLLQIQSNEAAVLEERKRLARDLHDTVSQQLFAIHMQAASLPKLMEVKPDKVNGVIEQLIVVSQQAQMQMRSLIAQLRPLELENRSLAEALDQWFPVYCRQNGLQGKLLIQLKEGLPEAVEHQLFLMIQEGMANVVKHAHAETVSLSISDMGHQFQLILTDDGIGFRVDKGQPKSYGLSTMKERSEKLGGRTEILSREGMGTTIKVYIPKFS